MANSEEVLKIMNVLFMAYPNFSKDVGPEKLSQMIGVYEAMLSDVPYEALQASAKQHLRTNKWFPSIAELAQGAFDLSGEAGEKQDLEARAVASWHQYKKARFASKTPTDPLVDVVSEMFDHQGFGMSNVEDESYWANMWIKLYVGVARQTERERRMSPEVKQIRDELQAGQRQQEVQDRLAEVAKRLTAGNGRAHD